MTGHVYFVECGGRIKIGYSTNVEARMKALETGAPHSLTLLATIPGSQGFERAIHSVLGAHRHKGEWFDDCAAVRSLISEVTIRGYVALSYEEKAAHQRESRSADLTKAVLIVAHEIFGRHIREPLAILTGSSVRTVSTWISGQVAIDLAHFLSLVQSEEHGHKFLQAFWDLLPIGLREAWFAREMARREAGAEDIPQ